MNFTLGEHSARHLRYILRTYLDSWGMSELADSATLALTELVANVVRHVPDRRAAVLLLWQPGGVRVEVSDTEAQVPEFSTAVDNFLDPADSGRGLVIVEAVTDRWGWYRTPTHPTYTGKTVWFECDGKCSSKESV
ncbi:ATP-binding protein [Streptomyces sp. NPDC020898]|uniref:ATP-binding protein n=1 Tax=Streptomyces sp. NPDC020898 TaxID=3365101 RepID=UPI0037956AE7